MTKTRTPQFTFRPAKRDEVIPKTQMNFHYAPGRNALTLGMKQYKKVPFQVEDLQKLAMLEHSANWSDMGCFKTTTAEWLLEEQEAARVLIITTKTGKTTYFETLPAVLPDYEVLNATSQLGIPKRKTKAPYVVLAHYNLFTNRSKVAPLLQGVQWDLVILDEAHRIKNPKAQCTKHIKRLKSVRRHIMTGTGFINAPDEVWSLLHFLYPKEYSSYWFFRDRFCATESYAQYSKVIGIKRYRIDEFKGILQSVGVRRTKEEVFKDLPALYPPTNIPIQLNPVQRKMYDAIKWELYALDQAGYPLHSPNVLSQLMRLRQTCVATPKVTADYYDEKLGRRKQTVVLEEPSSKMDALMEVLESTQRKVVVFTTFNGAVELAKTRMDKAEIPYIHMKQADNEIERTNKVMNFQQLPASQAKVFISTLALGGESITLTAADTVLFIDKSWSPKDNMQARDRVYRPGQSLPTQQIYLQAEKTVDLLIESRLKDKQHWFDMIFKWDK